MGLRTDTRERMVASAAVLLSEQGVGATSVAKVLEHSNGPRGSVGDGGATWATAHRVAIMSTCPPSRSLVVPAGVVLGQ